MNFNHISPRRSTSSRTTIKPPPELTVILGDHSISYAVTPRLQLLHDPEVELQACQRAAEADPERQIHVSKMTVLRPKCIRVRMPMWST